MVQVFGNLEPSRFRVCVVDPPWRFVAGTESRPQHYPRLNFSAVLGLPVGSLLHPDGARVFVWITAPLLSRAGELGKAWGLRYCSIIPWIKLWPREKGENFTRKSLAMGTGYEVRGNAEYVLIFKSGVPQSIKGNPFPGVFLTPRREHSRKPVELLQEIERRLEGPRCELFSRQQRQGWETFGDETGRFSADP